MSGFDTVHWPTEIRLKQADKVLEVDYDDGSRFRLPAEYLRVESPSAEVQGHGPDQKQLVVGKSRIGMTRVDPVGNYAIRIHFDDTHDTGIYSWSYLYELGRDQEKRWQAYLGELAKAGKNR